MAIELAIKTLSFGRTISYQVSLTVLGSAALQRSRVSSCEVEAGNTYGLQLMNKAQFWGTAATLFFPQVGTRICNIVNMVPPSLGSLRDADSDSKHVKISPALADSVLKMYGRT